VNDLFIEPVEKKWEAVPDIIREDRRTASILDRFSPCTKRKAGKTGIP